MATFNRYKYELACFPAASPDDRNCPGGPVMDEINSEGCWRIIHAAYLHDTQEWTVILEEKVEEHD